MPEGPPPRRQGLRGFPPDGQDEAPRRRRRGSDAAASAAQPRAAAPPARAGGRREETQEEAPRRRRQDTGTLALAELPGPTAPPAAAESERDRVRRRVRSKSAQPPSEDGDGRSVLPTGATGVLDGGQGRGPALRTAGERGSGRRASVDAPETAEVGDYLTFNGHALGGYVLGVARARWRRNDE